MTADRLSADHGALWRDPAASVEDRVTDLLARMTPTEKVSQLYGIWVGADSAGGDVAPHQHDLSQEPVVFTEIIDGGLGQLTRPFGTAPIDPTVGAESLAHSQRQIMAANRFGIPALVHEECLTGLAAWQATIFPSPLCWGATFDPDLIDEMATEIGRQMRGLGVHQGLAPVLDVTWDLRWGRVEETIGEDPLLVGRIATAFVRGLQSTGVIATLKHFVGYSASTAGRNLAPVSIGPREIADILLPPFEMALAAGVGSVMNSYTSLDGVPAGADAGLLTDLLRDHLGFTGTVVADYFAVAFLHKLHGVADSLPAAARLALHAGIDVELPTAHCYPSLADDAAATAEIDRAARRVLTQKAELGLLDPDYTPEVAGPIQLDTERSRALARTVAQRSVVLLRNESGVLPLSPGTRLAVVGPRAAEPTAMLGCYSFPLHVGVHHPDTPLGVPISSLLDALRTDAAGYSISYASGGSVTAASDAEIAEAAEAARNADIVIAVIGDQAGLFGRGTSGEGCDAIDLTLPGRQGELLDALIATGTPVIAVLLIGRPYDLSAYADRLAGIICGFFPGQEGAGALADVLSGRVNPSGRLPVSFPTATMAQPATYLSPQLAQRSEVSSVDPTPLYPFGYGLSYAPVTWESVELSGQTWSTDGELTATVTLHGAGERDSSEVVQIYLHDPVAEVVRPEQYLLAAAPVRLPAGETATVTITLHADQVSYTGIDRRRRVEAGALELRVGRSSRDYEAVLPVQMVGDTRFPGVGRTMEPQVTVRHTAPGVSQ